MRNFLLISFFAIICSLTNAQNQAPSASQVETTFDQIAELLFLITI
jgi:hypothetical protein